jgi:hypothetical protein
MYCPHCGARADNGAHFCTQCGASLDAVAAAVAPPAWPPALAAPPLAAASALASPAVFHSGPVMPALAPQPAGRRWLNWVFWLGVVVLAFALTHYVTPQSGTPAVVDATMVRTFSDNAASQEQARAYESDDPFVCAVRVSNVQRGQVIAARWYLGDTLLKDTTYTLHESGSGYIGFTLSPAEGGWPQGKYHVDILLDGDKARSVDFAVRGV